MLEPSEDRDSFASVFVSPALRFCLQFLLAYPVIFITSVPIDALLSRLGITSEFVPNRSFAGFEAVSCLHIALLVGWAIGKLRPELIATGIWIWLLPTVFIMADVVPMLGKSPPPLGLIAYFYATGSNEGLAVVFVTLPACCALGYSAGMFLARAERMKNAPPVLLSRVVLILIWFTTFAALIFLMREVQNRTT